MTDARRSERWMPKTAATEQRIEWCVKQPPQAISFLGTSFELTAAALRKTFGEFPIQLNKFEHEKILTGMAAVGGTPYTQLLEALQTFIEIEIRQA